MTMQIKPKYLPIASGSALGGIKIGSGLSIDGSGVVIPDVNYQTNGDLLPESGNVGALGSDTSPWTSAHTQILDLGNTAAFPSGHKPGTVTFDGNNFNAYSKYDGVINQLGKESWVDAQNYYGAPISNGQVCRILSAASANIRVTLAKADTTENCTGLLGIATSDIDYPGAGEITTFGLVNGINTNAFEEGDTLYLSPSVAGGLTNVRPTSPNKAVPLGIVVNKGVGNGSILVTISVPPCAADAFTGLKDPSKWSLSYVEGTRIATVTVSADTDVTAAGLCMTVPAGVYALPAHADATNVYYIYVNGSGVPEIGTSFTFGQQAIVGYIYYNGTANIGVLFNELHPDTWPAALHSYHHRLDGARLISGGTLSGYVTGSSTTSNMQYSIDSVTMADESLQQTLTALTGGNGAYTYWYRSGADAAGEWSWTTGANLPFPVSGTEMQWNQLTGGNWQLTNVTTANRWIVIWVVSTNAYAASFNSPHRYVNIVGQTLHTTLASAQSASFLTAISWGVLPFAEICPLAKIIMRYTNTSGNDFDIVSVESIRGTKASVTSTVSPTYHNGLSGRSDTGAHPATAVSYSNATSGLIAGTSQEAIDEIVLARSKYVFGAQSLDSALGADWALNGNAALSNDSSNGAIVVRVFGDAAELGCGTQAIYVPSYATKCNVTIHWRAVTAPGGAVGVVWKLYHRSENNTVSAWTSLVLDTASTSDTNWVITSQTITLITLGITAGDKRQFELTRTPLAAPDTLTGNAILESIILEFA